MENLDPNQPISEKPTVIFEARLRPFIEDELNSNHLKLAHAQLSNLIQELEVENVICNIDNDMLPLLAQLSDAWKLWASQEIESLVPVEIIAIENQEKPSHLRLRDVLSRFCVYRMHGVPPPPPRLFEGSDSTTSIEAYDDPEIPSAEVFDMPHHDFDGKWEELIFDQNHKEDLSWMISNILTFSADTGHAKKRMNPMALFHATLLSKYFSESATQVDDLLNKVKIMCQNNPSRIIIVLIDEVESIAVSRHSGVMHGEAQDSLRATNSLLTGLDTVMTCPNVVFMSTSNMIDCLDEAFVDRCAIRIPFQPPSEESQYKILKASVLELIRREIIIADLSNLLDSTQLIQSWQEATLYTAFQNDSATGKLLNIIMQLNSPTAKNKLGISGRFLTQIPEQALMKCARPNKSLTLDVALDCIEKFVQDLLTARGGQKRKLSEVEAEVQPGAKHYCYCAAEKDE
ncbi:hypothetical protein SS1G_12812 [Sclerotinia sclerotiorum 1980 UF-70]|uniref:Uncharacterized protein n=1 Tax=Sclerotinia sclerotiorum (strain ATCC 18683 / 1980 / Ss-1) TaxID=665079 RepID=A7F5D5_SCLS1|nr:hypothetical protein SS1G_12812 [Sclerotinia sclerotiorum 1980 UF-70]EDN97956.1 hypothetical protein SS1G_12812 [Sclerotinia sclerotiorum 1980 UF-70]